jgi:hypothetical protein
VEEIFVEKLKRLEELTKIEINARIDICFENNTIENLCSLDYWRGRHSMILEILHIIDLLKTKEVNKSETSMSEV